MNEAKAQILLSGFTYATLDRQTSGLGWCVTGCKIQCRVLVSFDSHTLFCTLPRSYCSIWDMHTPFSVNQTLCSLGTVAGRAWSCAVWAPGKTTCVRLWINMQSPHCTSHITQPALRRQARPMGKDISVWITEEKLHVMPCLTCTTFEPLALQMNFSSSDLPPQPWMKLKCPWIRSYTSDFCRPVSQAMAPTETEDNPVDYWHCREIHVRFHSTIIHNNSLITNFPCQAPQH